MGFVEEFGIENIKSVYPELSSTLDEIVKLHEYYIGDINDADSNYSSLVTSTLNEYPVLMNSRDGLYNKNFGDIDLSEAKRLLKEHLSSLEALKYLSFLKNEKAHIVFVGANGSGKTTLVKKLQSELKNENILFFPADRILYYKTSLQTERSMDGLLNSIRNNYSNSLNNEDYSVDYAIQLFTQYIDLLFKEYSHEINNGIHGNAHKVIEEWNNLIKTRQLFVDYGISVKPTGASNDQQYSLKQLSSGEKSILYFLMCVLLSDDKKYYFVDEPENNLNPAIVSELWDFIEKEKPNSTFVYLTHDNSFATSRIGAKEYWIKKFDGQKWEYEQLSFYGNDLPKNVLIDLLGTRQPVIFCESEDNTKYDYRLFKHMFKDFKIIPSGGCDKVIGNVKSYKLLKPTEKPFGIIDRDYKDQNYLTLLSQKDVYAIPTFEIEGFMVQEDFVKAVINHYLGGGNEALVDAVKTLIKNDFINDKDRWIVRHVAFDLRDKFDYRSKIKPLTNINDFKQLYNNERLCDADIDAKANQYEQLFNAIVSRDSYDEYLAHLDEKDIVNKIDTVVVLPGGMPYVDAFFNLVKTGQVDSLLSAKRAAFFPRITQ